MRGQIIPRGKNVFLVRIPLGRTEDGSRSYHNKTIHGTKRDAEAYRTKKLRELDVGEFVQASNETVSSFMKRWLETCVKPRVRTRTYEDYVSQARLHLSAPLGAIRLSQLTPGHIQSAYAAMLQKPVSPRTVRYAHSVLHGALEQAVRWGAIAKNPAKLVELPRYEPREMKSLDRPSAVRLLQEARGSTYGPLWILLLASGLRPGEALGLKWSDITGDAVRIQRSLAYKSKQDWTLAEPKTRRARRTVVLPPSGVAALADQQAAQKDLREQAGDLWADLDLVFTDELGRPLDWHNLYRRHFTPLVHRLGLEGLRGYDLRHSCATLLLSAGENVKVVSERLGHASAALTLDVYSHVLPDMQQRAASRLEELLFDSPSSNG